MKVYEMITDKIISKMEQGEIPWKKPWKFQGPCNYVTRRPYHGVNFLLLTMSDFSSPYWLTFKQTKEFGGYIKKGSKGTPVIFWKIISYVDADGTEADEVVYKDIPFMQYYTLFNLEQTEGIIKLEDEKEAIKPLEACEQIVAGYKDKPEITHTIEPRAYYVPSDDRVHMPSMKSFVSSEEYYSTLFHELTHSTGHKNRLNRHSQEDANFDFGSAGYSKEELVAELGSAFLCAEAKIDNSIINNSTAYLQSWLKVLKEDKKLIIYASARASKAANYILGHE